MRLHRLLGIIMLLDSRGTMKAGNLAKILETSERTIYRDIDILCEAGIPIVSIPGPTGGYSFMEGYRINSGSLERGDVFNLLLSSMGIRPEKDSEMEQQLKNAVIKLENSVSVEHREEIIRARERFFLDTEPWWGKSRQNQNIDIIKKAVLDLKKLRIHYCKHNGEASERIIRPYGVVVKDTEWYVAAFCEARNEIRVFKCSRIDEVEVLDEGFSMPEHFSLQAFWQESKQQFVRKATAKSGPSSYPVKLRLLEEKRGILEGFYFNSFRQRDGSWLYEMDLLSFETACNMIFPICDRAEVLAPSELREYIIDKTKKIMNLYKLK